MRVLSLLIGLILAVLAWGEPVGAVPCSMHDAGHAATAAGSVEPSAAGVQAVFGEPSPASIGWHDHLLHLASGGCCHVIAGLDLATAAPWRPGAPRPQPATAAEQDPPGPSLHAFDIFRPPALA